jgi:hypothetical protein
VPLVIDAQTTPTPTPTPSTLAWAVDAELAVLGALTVAVDLEKEESRRLVLATIAAAGLSDDRLGTYTHLIRAAAPASAREALEALMSTVFKDEFIERYIAEGRAKGEAEGRAKGEAAMLLRFLSARGFEVPDRVREHVLACADLDQLGAWADAAATARTLDDLFSAD